MLRKLSLCFKQSLAFLMCLVFAVSGSPAALQAMAADSGAVSASGSFCSDAFGNGTASEIINPGKPTGYDENDESNPFGYKKNEAFRIYEDSELLTYFTHQSWGIDSNLFDSYTRDEDAPDFLDEGSWGSITPQDFASAYGDGNQKKHWFLQTVSFDPTGLGRKTVVGFIGIAETNDNSNNLKLEVDAWVYDTISKKASPVFKIDDVTQMIYDFYRVGGRGDQERDETLEFQVRNFLSITAGDYDNDGKDTLVVYVAADDSPVLKELEVTESSGGPALAEVGTGGGKILHPQYMNNLEAFKSLYTAAGELDGRDRLGCQLTTGDINSDHIDDLVVLSYTNRIDEGLQKSYGEEIFKPYLAVKEGKEKLTAANGLFDPEEGRTAYIAAAAEVKDNDKYIPTAGTPTATIAKLSPTGHRVILVGGYEKHINYKAKDESFDSVSYNSSRQTLFVYQLSDSLAYQNYFSDDLPAALNLNRDQFGTWSPLMTTAVSINGSASPDWIFSGGRLYEIDDGQMTCQYTIPFFDEAVRLQIMGDIREVFISDVKPVCLTKFGGNYQSLVFSVGVYWHNNIYQPWDSGSKHRYHYLAGIAGPNIKAGELKPDSYYGDSRVQIRHIEEGASFIFTGTPSNAVFCPVDYTDDGLLARFSSKNYIYTDAEVLAVLQAAPYFSELGNNYGATEYTFSNTFEYTDGTSTTKSGAVGFEAAVASEYLTVNFKSGASYETRDWTDKTLKTTYSTTFTADAHDSVIVFRTPVISYSYDIWNSKDDNPTWKSEAMALTYVEGCEFVQLSIADYNSLVDEYNAAAEKREKESGKKINRLEKLADNLYLGNEGKPTEYYGARATGQTEPEQYTILSKVSHALGLNGGSDASEYIYGSTVTTGTEKAQGFNISFDVTAGYYAQAGVYESYEELSGHSTSTANTDETGTKELVTNLNLEELVKAGFDEKTVRSYGFNWQPAKWNSNLKFEYKDKNDKVTGTRTVPVYGYTVKNVQKPASRFADSDEKAANPMKVKGKTVKVSFKKLKKKSQAIKASKAMKFSNKGQGKKTYKKVSVSKKKSAKKFTVNSNTGKINVKKGVKKGSYTVTIKVTAAGNNKYLPVSKNVKVKILVK